MAVSAVQELRPEVTALPRLAAHKDRPGDLPAGVRLERWAARLQGRV